MESPTAPSPPVPVPLKRAVHLTAVNLTASLQIMLLKMSEQFPLFQHPSLNCQMCIKQHVQHCVSENMDSHNIVHIPHNPYKFQTLLTSPDTILFIIMNALEKIRMIENCKSLWLLLCKGEDWSDAVLI